MENKLNLLQRLNEFRKKVGVVKKDGSNPHYKSKYATIESVLETIDKPLDDCGLGYIQVIKKWDDIFCLSTIVFNADNTVETIENSVPLLAINDMQKLGSAITYARRYGLVSIFGLEQEDDDGNATVKQPSQTNNISTIPTTKKTDAIKSMEKKADGEQCSNCEGTVKVLTSKAGNKYWKCNCGLFGYNIKTQEEVENEKLESSIPF